MSAGNPYVRSIQLQTPRRSSNLGHLRALNFYASFVTVQPICHDALAYVDYEAMPLNLPNVHSFQGPSFLFMIEIVNGNLMYL